ncbi:hypothetical protein BVI2075_50003 [Burkholderia vietnamiensis]|nr:hypothetical protein BVI2075_50003 [Burkholderia vietnamiensis]
MRRTLAVAYAPPTRQRTFRAARKEPQSVSTHTCRTDSMLAGRSPALVQVLPFNRCTQHFRPN